MVVDLLLLVVGLGLLLGGGDALVRGAVALAERFGIPAVIVGLTVVAFGTSTPELVVNLVAAYRGTSEIGFGNVIGSNIANIGLLLGLTALYRPLTAHPSVVTREIPMMLLASLAALIMAEDVFLTGRDANLFNRDDGVLLLLLFGVFLYYTVADALRQRGEVAAEFEQAQAERARPRRGWLIVALLVGGLAALIVGGQFTVNAAVSLARGAGVPEVVIGLTIVAVGTSLPELATCVAAARRGESDVAVGNIVGSNIYNLLFIFGCTAAIAPIPLPDGGIVDLVVMLGFSLALLPIAMTHQKRITRLEGGVLLLLYAAYTVWLALR